jgi:hypothetical protein
MGAESHLDREILSSLILPDVAAFRSFMAVGLVAR